MMSKFNNESAKTKTPLSMRWAQMSKQEQIIEKKKMEIQAKVEAQRRTAKLMAKADESKGVTAANIFSNDGSFMDQFKKLIENNDPLQEPGDTITKTSENEGAKDESLEEPCTSREPETLEVAPTPTDKPTEQTNIEERRDHRNNDRRFDRGDRSQHHWNANDRVSGGSRQQDNQTHPQQTPPKPPIPSLMQNPVMPPGMRQYSSAPPNINSPMYQNNPPFPPMQSHPNDSGEMGNANFPNFPPPFNRHNFMPRLPGQTSAPPPLNAPMLPPPSFNTSKVPPTNLPPPPTNFSTGPPPNFPSTPGPPNFSTASAPPNFTSPAPPDFTSPAPPNFTSAPTPPNFSSAASHPCNMPLQPPSFPFMMPPNFHNQASPSNMPFAPPLPPNPAGGNVGRINQRSPAEPITIPPPQSELHIIPPPGMLNKFPKAEVDICNIPPPPLPVLSADTRVTPAMEDAAKQVARTGQLWENMLKSRQDSALWFLQEDKSVEYNLYQSLVKQYRKEFMEEQQKTNNPPPIPKEEKYDPEFSLHDEDSSDGYNNDNKLKVESGNNQQASEFENVRSGGFNNRKNDGYVNRRDDGFSNRQDGAFGNRQDGGFGNSQDSGFGNRQDGGFGNRQDGSFGNRQDGGFGNRHDGGFGNRHDGGFDSGRNDGFHNRRDGEFDNRNDSEFDNRWGGGMDNKRDAGFENRRDDGFENRRAGGGFDSRRGGRADDRRDSGSDTRKGGRFDNRINDGFDSRRGGRSDDRRGGGFDGERIGRSDDRRDDGFDNKGDSDFEYRRDAKFDNRGDTDFHDNRADLQHKMKDLIGFGGYQESSNKADARFDSKRDIKRERKHSDSDEDVDTKAEKRKKRKSRWGEGDAQSADVGLPGVACISGLGETVVPTIIPAMLPSVAPLTRPGDPLLLARVTRSNPALLQYARMNYGSTNLSEEEWVKCEDNYKLNLLYQDMMRKKQELEKLAMAGQHKHEYDSDEDTDQGTWEHKLRSAEIEATKQWATELTKRAAGKHHIGDFLPPEELKKFMEKYSAIKSGKEPDLSDYKEFKLGEDNIGFQMLQKLGWNQGHGLGAEGTGIVEPVNKAPQRDTKQGLGLASMDDLAAGDDEFDAYRKRMMMAYRFRPNPLNNPRRPYY